MPRPRDRQSDLTIRCTCNRVALRIPSLDYPGGAWTGSRQEHLALIERRCRERKLPATVQRRLLLETLLELDGLPQADAVFAAVQTAAPGTSRTTVYRALETFVRLGVITRACHPGHAVRYDANIDLHHHLICLRCERVIAIVNARLDALPIPDTHRQGFTVSDFRVQLRGLCRDCRDKESER